MPEPTAAEQHQMLRVIWAKWRTVASSTGKTDKVRAEEAVNRLYQFYRQAVPAITWIDSMHRLPAQAVGMPILSHCRETLIYSVWHKLCDPAWVCSQVGYDPLAGTFRLPGNKHILMGRAYVTPRRPGRRPPWLTDGSNMISQFDVDALAIQELGQQSAIPIDPAVRELAEIVNIIVTSCFAIICFEKSCLLVMKPARVMLNEAQQLSARNAVAFESCHARTLSRSAPERYRLYVINGKVVGVNTAPTVSIDTLNWASPATRVPLIEYMGWDRFYHMMVHDRGVTQLARDRYGKLHLIRMRNQEFLLLEVQNKTPEPDGHYRTYFIPVDRNCRPLPDPRKPWLSQDLGSAQQLTPLNAVASTFGMTGERYAAILGQES